MAIERKGLYTHVGEYYVIDKDYPITIGTLKKGSVIQVTEVRQELPMVPKLTMFCVDVETKHGFTMYEDNFIEHTTPAKTFENMSDGDKEFWAMDRWLQYSMAPYWVGAFFVILIVGKRFL